MPDLTPLERHLLISILSLAIFGILDILYRIYEKQDNKTFGLSLLLFFVIVSGGSSSINTYFSIVASREQKRISDSTIAVKSAQLDSMETTGTITKRKVSNLEEKNMIEDSIRFLNDNIQLANILEQIAASTNNLFFHFYSTEVPADVLRKEMSTVAAQIEGLMKSQDDNPVLNTDKYFKEIWLRHLDSIQILRFLIDGYGEDDRLSLLTRLCDNNRQFQTRINMPIKDGMYSPNNRIRKRARKPLL